MGISGSNTNNQAESKSNKSCIKKAEDNQNDDIHEIKEVIFEAQTNEIDELKTYEHATCKIQFKKFQDGKILKGFGIGFFCEINDKNIPFNKALFTSSHILDKNNFAMNESIGLEYCGKITKINITKNRNILINEELNYTCVEVFDSDKITINKYFNIDKTLFNDKNFLIKREIFILQYTNDNLSYQCGKILDIKNNKIEFILPTKNAPSGSPLIKRYNNHLVIGLHYGSKEKETEMSSQKEEKSNDQYGCDLATPFDVIIQDIIDKLSKNDIYNKEFEINFIGKNLKKDDLEYYLPLIFKI